MIQKNKHVLNVLKVAQNVMVKHLKIAMNVKLDTANKNKLL